MNPLIIILGVVVVFLAYKLYVIYTSAPTVASNIYLGSTKTELEPVSPKVITSPNSSVYTIGFWIYVNTFSSSINEFIAFGNSNSASGGNTIIKSDLDTLPNSSTYVNNYINKIPQNVCTFSMDDYTPTLYANISTCNTAGSSRSYYVESIPITTNMPIQTWTYVLVSVSTNAGNYADCYINGKLLVSQQLKNIPYNIGSTNSSITKIENTFLFPGKSTENNVVDVYLTKITWISDPVDPQTVWYYYNQGNGNPSGTGSMSTYHLEVDFTKDDDKIFTWKPF